MPAYLIEFLLCAKYFFRKTRCKLKHKEKEKEREGEREIKSKW